LPQAFGRWFANMYFQGVTQVTIPDGSGDGKIDLLVTCQVSDKIRYRILNTKFTNEYGKNSPVAFYDEITRFWQAFENKGNRQDYLTNVVRQNLREHYKRLFKLYDEGKAELFFVTNHKANENQFRSVERYGMSILHLEEVLQYVAEHTEGAMPETESLLLSGISNPLTPPPNESEVPTSIVFARLIDFIRYMADDPFDLLFARNVRLWLGNTETNQEIQKTFKNAPKEFAYSNNGITILCKKHTHNLGKQELLLENPRVVNGSQTLHSIRQVDNPSPNGRVMVRIIEVPVSNRGDLPAQIEKRKEVIHKISMRSNQQNPIKRWNLVSNDDFQNDLARYFWAKHLYYERRQNEWRMRKMELQTININRGPELRWMVQLIASSHYNSRKLGPAVAQGQINLLFEEDSYAVIRSTSPEKAYQFFVLGEIMGASLRRLRGSKRYIANLKTYIDLCLYALICKALFEAGISFGKEALNERLDALWNDGATVWDQPIKALIDIIYEKFTAQKTRVLKKEGKELSVANYVKSRTEISNLLAVRIPKPIKKALASTLEKE
jgi:hypothetical protein